LADRHDTITLPASFAELLDPDNRPINDDEEFSRRITTNLALEIKSSAMDPIEEESDTLTIGLIDRYQFSRECLIKAIDGLHSHIRILPFASVQRCVAEQQSGLDLIIYYSRANDVSEAATVPDVTAICQAFPSTRLIVLSDADDAQQPRIIRSMLKSGAHGFIPTQTTGIQVAFAAIGFVKAGGTFAPLDLLLTSRAECGTVPVEAAQQSSLTSRQMEVLSQLRLGKANKLIAYELNMSESTVKVHVRNIMRKMGATNRTQAAYKAQQLWNSKEHSSASQP
jgi:DNA-binding NarL/FixJ family response regulator